MAVTDNLDKTAVVFASSYGDLDVTDKINTALIRTEKNVSPTQFHNSVHNAIAGYWMIAQAMQAPSVSISAGEETFSAGLIDAITQVITNQQTVLFVAYDNIAPTPLNTAHSVTHSLAISLRLSLSKESNSIGHINASIGNKKQPLSHCQNTSLQPLHTGNPIGIGLPLLEALACRHKQQVILPYVMGQQIIIAVNS